MRECERWYGPPDGIALDDLAQSGALGIVGGIVTGLHDVPAGEVWTVAAIRARQAVIAARPGHGWQVVDNLPVHPDILHGSGDLSRLLANYRQSLANLAASGIRTVCYRFGPVMDTVRTHWATPTTAGWRSPAYSTVLMAAFDIHILRRPGAGADCSDMIRSAAQNWSKTSTIADRDRLSTRILAALPCPARPSLRDLRRMLSRFNGFATEALRAHFARFLAEVLPAADDLGLRLCLHPDDPPHPLFGLPRLAATEADIAWSLDQQTSAGHGLAFGSGAFAARHGNDVIAMARRFAPRTHVLHLGNVAKSPDGSFTEASALDGDVDMVALVSVWLAEEARRRDTCPDDAELPYYADHGPDYSLNPDPGQPMAERSRDLAELRGVIRTFSGRSFADRCRSLIVDLRLAARHDVVSVRPLTGGVASDIGVINLGHRQVCVKFALEKLKVAADWRAPVHRNRAEYEWLRFAGSVAPANIPALFGWSQAENGFVMEYLAGPDVVLWKAALLAGTPQPGAAARVADLLGRIHQASTRPGFDAAPFRNRDDFRALRLEPYLSFTASSHPSVAARLTLLAEQLYQDQRTLVHGDVSPKNILLRGGQPILLDAECATMGDPAFDLAFCLNHLVLKALHLPAQRTTLLADVGAFWASYRPQISWEPAGDLERRVTALLPALMLARIDGKSPVEYLAPAERDQVRALSLALLCGTVNGLGQLAAQVQAG